MKLIHLGGKYGSVIGNYALVDDEDFDMLNKFNWYAKKYKNGLMYAMRIKHGIKRKGILFHRFLLNAEKGTFIDHHDRNGLNNQRENLRFCTRQENQRNRNKQVNNKTGYKGVSFDKRRNKFMVRIDNGLNYKHVGIFEDVIEAAKAYDEAAKKYHGEFAFLNFPNTPSRCSTYPTS